MLSLTTKSTYPNLLRAHKRGIVSLILRRPPGSRKSILVILADFLPEFSPVNTNAPPRGK